MKKLALLFILVANIFVVEPAAMKGENIQFGAYLVKDILPGSFGSSPYYLAEYNGELFFTASDGITTGHGAELWKSDGTEAGTVLVKDVYPGLGGSLPTQLTQVNGTLFFTAHDGFHCVELWKSDGTEAGTMLVKDIYPGDFCSAPKALVNVDGTLFFLADDGIHGEGLWRSDGTEAGTLLVKDINRASKEPELVPANGLLYFAASDEIHGQELWKSDGTEAGTVMVRDIWPGSEWGNPENLVNVDGTLFFVADDGIHNAELWKSDGTEAGTVMVKDIDQVSNWPPPYELIDVNGTLFFFASDGVHWVELWKSDGTESGTFMVKDVNPFPNIFIPKFLTNVNGIVFWHNSNDTYGAELWKSDGTAAGTMLAKDINPGESYSKPRSLTNVNGTLFFVADDGIHGDEVWMSDGTPDGTILVQDIVAGSKTSYPTQLTSVNNLLFFQADDETHGQELWAARKPDDENVVDRVYLPAIIKDKQHQTVEDQYQAAKETTYHIADMIEAGWDVAIGHGNGPQVGFILRRSEIAHKVEGMHEIPLDVCGADSQGAIGYALQQTLQNELRRRGMSKPVATVITQVRVDKDDPAFRSPSKPIGGFMDQQEANMRAEEMGWNVVEDAGRGWRRVVASPLPQEVMELESIKTLIDSGVVVVTVGGGGIPVVDNGSGALMGTAAVIDKDYASSLLARLIGADLLMISTAVEKVALNYGKPDQKWIDRMTLAEAKQYLAEGTHFARGSMAPKIQAVIWFLEAGGKQAIITNPENIGQALRGETGTWIVA